MIKQLFFFLTLILLLYGCPLDECLDFRQLPYEGTFSILPLRPVYKVGDTITYKSVAAIRDMFPDGEPFNYKSSSSIYVERIDSTDTTPASNFQTTLVVGHQTPLTHQDSIYNLPRYIALFIFNQQPDSIKAIIKIKLLKPGVYLLRDHFVKVDNYSARGCDQNTGYTITREGKSNYSLYESYKPSDPATRDTLYSFYFKVEK